MQRDFKRWFPCGNQHALRQKTERMPSSNLVKVVKACIPADRTLKVDYPMHDEKVSENPRTSSAFVNS